jgi:hypothetical protein
VTLSEVQTAIAKIEQGIADSVVIQSMTFGDQSFTFRSMDDMLKGLKYFKGLEASLSGRPTSRLAVTCKGA